ncbi:MAG TPA: hypothetical protein VLF43_04585 [Candidatus Saccharimonadales bacterium]|nr:hypothetical protein [Candidatus Saccharimonadales bacterium]
MKQAWQIGDGLSLLFALVANFLVGAQIVHVPAINQISDTYATVLTPAAYAFSIWSVIYLLLILFVGYQARDVLKPKRQNDLPQKIGPLFIIASICNGLWTYVFVQGYIGLSVFILLVLTASLYLLLARLRVAVYDAGVTTIVFVWWPLLAYTGWVTVASVVNIASWLRSLDIIISPAAGAIMLVALAVALIMLLVKRNVRELLLASIWGIVAIGVQQLNQTDGSRVVAMTALMVSGVLLGAVAVHAYKNRQTNVALRLLRHSG